MGPGPGLGLGAGARARPSPIWNHPFDLSENGLALA